MGSLPVSLHDMWGRVAALAAAHSLNHGRHPQPWVFVVLALEKIFYTGTWVWWLLYKPKPVNIPPWEASLAQMWQKDEVTALFFLVYGACSFVFALVFLVAAELGFAAPPPPRKRHVHTQSAGASDC